MRVVSCVVVVLGLSACAGPPGVVEDTAVHVPLDTASADAGSPTSDGGVDAGGSGTCSLTADDTMFQSLQSVCLPRCGSATQDAYAACADADCRIAALTADTLPAGSYRWFGVSYPLDCLTCFAIQGNHCQAAAGCAAEAWASATCDPATDPNGCASEDAATRTCLDAHADAFSRCMSDPAEGAVACFQ